MNKHRMTYTLLIIALLVTFTLSAVPTANAKAVAVPDVQSDVSSGSVSTAVASDDEAEPFFDDSYVHEIRIYFDDPDWYDALYAAHANDPDDPYFPARFEAEGAVLDPVGVRFKGNSSFSIPTAKKSFKIDFDEYDEDNDELSFLGLKKLNLHNSFKDPTMLREKLFLDFAGQYMPTIRAVHTRLYVNDEYWGLYTAVEQVDKTFAQGHFGDDEDGNLFKAAASDDGDSQDDFGSDLTWLGWDSDPYHDYYQLKTNEAADDYSQLVEFINVLNNESAGSFPSLLEPIFDVDTALEALALNNLFVNLDAYNGAAHNYYLYDRDDTNKITHLHWDTNEAFGRFLMFVSAGDDPLAMDPFWLPSAMGPPGSAGEERPLMENLWQNESYSNDYLCALDAMLDAGFDATTMGQRINELADIIRADVYADTNKMYSNHQFETNLTTDIASGRDTIYGLLNFVQQRSANLNAALDGYGFECTPDASLVGTLFVNEFMADNETTLEDPDEPGDYPDWFEIYNAGPDEVDLQGLYLTDDLTDPTQHAITTNMTVPAGGFVLFYADEDLEQGPNHVNFKLGASGDDLAILDTDGATLIDGYTFGAQSTDISEARCPDGGDTWAFMAAPTPGASNGTCGTPVISGTSHTPASPTSFDVVTVEATITDDGTLTATNLFYRVDGGSLVEVAMTAQGSDTYDAQIPAQSDGRLVDYYLFAADDSGLSSSDPAGAPGNTHHYLVGYDAPVLHINEFMADNDTILEDPDEPEDYPDWFEIYNPGSETVDLGGLYLTDDLSDPTQFQIPDGLGIPAGGYLLFYADGDTEQGDQHTSFKLSADGEDLALFGSDGATVVDSYTFGQQTTDVSEARCPDGGDTWAFVTNATPGASNSCGSSYEYSIYLPMAVRGADAQ